MRGESPHGGGTPRLEETDDVCEILRRKELVCTSGARLLWSSRSFRRSVGATAALLAVGLPLMPSAAFRALWAACAMLLPLAEAINDAIETVVNRISMDWNPMSRDAKDKASVLLPASCMPLCAVAIAAALAR